MFQQMLKFVKNHYNLPNYMQIRFHGKPLKIFPLINSTIDSINAKINNEL